MASQLEPRLRATEMQMLLEAVVPKLAVAREVELRPAVEAVKRSRVATLGEFESSLHTCLKKAFADSPLLFRTVHCTPV